MKGREREDLETPHQPTPLPLAVGSLKAGMERAKSFLSNAISSDEAVRGVIRPVLLQRRLVRKEWAFGLLQDRGMMNEVSPPRLVQCSMLLSAHAFVFEFCAGVARNCTVCFRTTL